MIEKFELGEIYCCRLGIMKAVEIYSNGEGAFLEILYSSVGKPFLTPKSPIPIFLRDKTFKKWSAPGSTENDRIYGYSFHSKDFKKI
jgi:hypothetical protein